MEKCNFCVAEVERDKWGNLPEGWGKARLETDDKEIEVTFCPKHREEAEHKLDIAFGISG